MRFPAFCPACGLIFPSAIALENASNVTLSGQILMACPRCGADAETPDGTFNVHGDTVELLAGSALTRERMFRFAELLRDAQEGRLSEAAALRRVSEESPAMAALISRYRPIMGRALLSFLALVLSVVLAQGISEMRDDSATRADIESAIEQALEICMRPQ